MKKLVFIAIILGFALLILKARDFMGYNGTSRIMEDVSPIDAQTSPIAVTSIPTSSQQTSDVPYRIEKVVENLYVPWSIVWTSPSRMIFTERNGKIRVFENNTLRPQPLIEFSEVSATSEEGLMGMALDPSFETNKQLYVCLAYPAGGSVLKDKIVMLRDQGDRLTVEKVILDGIPAAQYHAGCRLRFGPDGRLYITTGEATDKEIAQDLSSLGGKILRINSDGSIPQDNPFPNSPIWSYGHRNPQGIDWHPVSKLLFSSEHGPSGFDGPGGGDEVNIIEKGGNYGWPLVSHEKTRDGTIAPKIVFTPAVAPASGMFYSGNLFPQFKNNFFFGLLRGEGIMRVVVDDKNSARITSFEKLQGIDVGRIRDVAQGPDGAIYFSTSNRDGRGKPTTTDDTIYRIKAE